MAKLLWSEDSTNLPPTERPDHRSDSAGLPTEWCPLAQHPPTEPTTWHPPQERSFMPTSNWTCKI